MTRVRSGMSIRKAAGIVSAVISMTATLWPTAGWAQQPPAQPVGALWNQIWSFSGNPDRADVNQMFLQPFLSYQATKTLTLTLQSETSANWEIDEGRWTVPINVVVSKLSRFGSFPASYQFGFGGFAVHPDTGPSWKVRSAVVILLPRRQ